MNVSGICSVHESKHRNHSVSGVLDFNPDRRLGSRTLYGPPRARICPAWLLTLVLPLTGCMNIPGTSLSEPHSAPDACLDVHHGAGARQDLSSLTLPRPLVPSAPAAERDCLGTWALEGGHGRALGQNSDVRRTPRGRVAPAPPSREAANTLTVDMGPLCLEPQALPDPSPPWMVPTRKLLGSCEGPGQRDHRVLVRSPGRVLSLPRTEHVSLPQGCFLIWEMARTLPPSLAHMAPGHRWERLTR